MHCSARAACWRERAQEAAGLLGMALAAARRACVPMDRIQNLFRTADWLCRLCRKHEACALLDGMVRLAEVRALPHDRIIGASCGMGLAPPAQRDLWRMEALLRQQLALRAEARQAPGDMAGARDASALTEVLLAGMPVRADAVAKARRRLATA